MSFSVVQLGIWELACHLFGYCLFGVVESWKLDFVSEIECTTHKQRRNVEEVLLPFLKLSRFDSSVFLKVTNYCMRRFY